jgi:hypothetical protein
MVVITGSSESRLSAISKFPKNSPLKSFLRRRSVNTNIPRFEVKTSSIGILQGRIYLFYLCRPIGDTGQSNVLPRDVDLRTSHVDNKKQVCSAVVPETGVHVFVVVISVRGKWVDEEGLDDFFSENGDLSCHSLDCRGIAGCGRVVV